MTLMKTIACIIAMVLFLSGCALDVKQGIYEGARTRANLQSTPAERSDKPATPDYLEYERLRKERENAQ